MEPEVKKKGLSVLEKAAGCGKKRPPSDLVWLFSQVTEAERDNSKLFQVLPGGIEGVSLLEQQTYRQWRSLNGQQRLSHPRRLRQRTIIIQPFKSPSLPGYSLTQVHESVLKHLQNFCTVFFSGFTIELAPPLDLATLPNLTSRVHASTQRRQYLAGDIEKYLERRRRPRHAQCVVGVTPVDLYPSPQWNFVMGHASLTSGCAVFGFGRYFSSQFAATSPSSPSFSSPSSSSSSSPSSSSSSSPSPSSSSSAPTVAQQLQQLWVLCRVVTHELCHTLGMKHCYYFRCSMNESSSIEQASKQPLFLCPVCLRKLKKILRFDIFERYSQLKEATSRLTEVVDRSMRDNSSQVSCHVKRVDDRSGVEGSRINQESLKEPSLSSTYQLQRLKQAHHWLDLAINTSEPIDIGKTYLVSKRPVFQ